jgi:predicted outer membrane repeat protein
MRAIRETDMSATPAVRYVFALAVAFLSTAPISAREDADSAPLVWAPNPPSGVSAQICFTEHTGDNVTDFASADAQAVRDAVAAATTGGTIKVAGYCAGISSGHLVDISGKALSLRGGYTDTNWTTTYPITQPTTLDGVNAGRVIRTNRALTVENLSILNGLSSASPGGGIWNTSSTAGVILYTATLRNNNGGFVSSGWGGGVAATGPVTIVQSTFANNIAGVSGGGAVYAGRVNIVNSTFYSNTSAGDGGALLVNSTASLLNSTLSHNQANSAGGLGGGLWVSGTVYLTNTLIANNGPNDCIAGASSATTTLVEDGSCNATYSGDPSLQPLADNGGATWTMAVLLGSSAINQGSNALAPATDQRGVARPQNGIVDLGAFEAIFHVLTPTAGAGGAIMPGTPQTVSPGSSVTFTVVPSANHDVLDVGVDGVSQGALGSYTFANVTVDHVITAAFAPHTCYATPDSGTTVFGSANAQAVRNALGAVVPNGTVKVAGYCPGVAAQGGTSQTALITKLVTLSGGYTTTDWATYAPVANPTTLDALAGGRVIFASMAATLRGFTATNGSLSTPGTAHGGGIYAGGALTLTDLIVRGNTITGTAGGHSGGGVFGQGAVFAENTTLSNNAAKSGGGGLYATGALSLVGGAVENNRGQDGGGIYANATLALTGTRVVNNMALAGGWAGGAYVGATASLNGAVFQGNTSASRGGGLYVDDALTLTDTQFISNTANEGGGVNARDIVNVTGGAFIGNRGSIKHGGLYARGALTLANTRFIGNSTNGDGGGAFADDGATVERGLFQDNRSAGPGGGGGLYVYFRLALTGTQFIGNVAKVGGGLTIQCCNRSSVVNALFAANWADSNRGMDIYVADAALSLVHSTIASPTVASGSAVYGDNGGAVFMTNTLIASHTIGIDASAMTASDWNTVFDGVATAYSGTVISHGAMTGTAGFADPAIHDYRLSLGSIAVDAAIDAGVYTDFDGQTRPQGAGFDIGYDELPAWLITSTAGAGGVILPGTPQTVNDSGTAVFTITPDTGYHVLDVGVDGVSQGALGNYTFTNVTADHTITAAFGINTYTLTMTTTAFIVNSSAPTVTTPGAGSAGITPTAGVNPFSYGAVVTLTATAQFAWIFAGWTGDADCADGVVTMTTDMSCAARFETRQTYVPRVLP